MKNKLNDTRDTDYAEFVDDLQSLESNLTRQIKQLDSHHEKHIHLSIEKRSILGKRKPYICLDLRKHTLLWEDCMSGWGNCKDELRTLEILKIADFELEHVLNKQMGHEVV